MGCHQYWEIQTWRFFEIYHRVDGLKAFPLNFQAKPKMRSNPVSFEFAHRINRIDVFFLYFFFPNERPPDQPSRGSDF